MTAEHLARTYYRHINAKDLEGVLSVLSDNAVFNLPDGREVVGKDSLRNMYTHVFAQGGHSLFRSRSSPPIPTQQPRSKSRSADGSKLYMADFFAMGSGSTFDMVSVYQRAR